MHFQWLICGFMDLTVIFSLKCLVNDFQRHLLVKILKGNFKSLKTIEKY
jgi:hypothetical protein